MSDIIDFKIYGEELQAVEIELDPGEGIRAEVGALLYRDSNIAMNTDSGGGLLKGIKRMISGESFFISTFINEGNGRNKIGLAAPYPGKIIPIELKKYGGEYLCQKDSFLCSAKGVEIEIAFTKKFGAGFFGGEGFILQKFLGDGLVFIHAGGTIIEKKLEMGEKLLVDTGCIVGMENTVSYNIEFIGGFKNMLFGGEGLFSATLVGPGTVFLQSLPFSRLADRILSATHFKKDSNS